MRNKLKRSVLASLLAASMALGSLSVNVFADTGLNTDASVLTSPEKLETIDVENNGTEDNNENGEVEDTVQAVVELMNALPAEIDEETDLEALKAQVASARTAYDALTEGQKAAFDPEVLAKLTALEQKLSEPKPEKVTLTYDANAGSDEVMGLPEGETVKSGDRVFIKSYRNMKREGYSILGWSRQANANFPDNDLQAGIQLPLNNNITLYAVWEKNPDEKPEVPDGANLQEVRLQLNFQVTEGDSLQKAPTIHYDYSYKYGGKTYTGTTENEKLPFGLSNNQVLYVLVNENGTTPTEVQLTLKGQEVDGYAWYQQIIDNKLFTTEQATISVTSFPFGQKNIPTWHYYRQGETEKPDDTVTERKVDIMVAFETVKHDSFTLDNLPEDYSITYSYQNVEGETVTQTLYRKDATEIDTKRAIFGEVDGVTTIVDWDEEHLYHHLKWTVNIPVIGDGIYLTMTQSNYGVTEDSYVWDHVFGTTRQVDSENIGRLYVSKDNNPVTPYIYNVYAKEYTVTYTDGVENSVIFADQIFKAKEGAATPTISNPTRSGYTFTGWSPAVAETVTGDVTYTAQWSLNSTDPDPDPDPDPEPLPYTGGGDDDTPTIINDTPVPTTTIEDEEVPLADLPEDLITIEDEDVPLKNNPSTGDMVPVHAMAAALLSIGGIALLMKKRR